MSRLYRAIKALAGRGDRAAIATVVGYEGGQYIVSYGGTTYTVPAVEPAQARDGAAVAVLIDSRRNEPIAMLGPIGG